MPVVAATLAVAVAFAGLGLFVFARRLVGGFEVGAGDAAIAALALVAWGGALRGFARSVAPLNDRERKALEICLSLGVVALCLGVLAVNWAALLIVATVLLEEGWAWQLDKQIRAWRTRGPSRPVALLTVQETPEATEPDPAIAPEPEAIAEVLPPSAESLEAEPAEDAAEDSKVEAEEEAEEIEEELDPNVVQQQTRSRDDAGAEQISGWQRVTLAAGAQSAAAHIAFCPPLERAPQLEVHQLAGPDAQIKVAVSQPFGARFDIRLSKPAAEASELLIEYASNPAS
jgi:hypothetical protein